VAATIGFVGTTLAASPAQSPPAAPPDIAELALPTGALELVGHNASFVSFIDPAHTQRSGETAKVRVYQVSAPSFAGFRGSVQEVSDWQVDCRRMVKTSLGDQVFSEEGKLMFWDGPQDPASLRTGSSSDTIAEVVCGHASPPSFPTVIGGAATIQFSQALLRAPPILTIPKPKDAAAGARAVAQPTAADVAAALPPSSLPIRGMPRVLLLCVGGRDGALSACAISEEHPAGRGYSEAALRLIGKYRVAPVSPGFGSIEGAVFPFTIVFSGASSPPGGS
jgi:hypothetical protein